MIISFPAGSGVDVIGRAVAAAISQQTGQNVVVLNRDGAAGTLGFGALAAAAPDGHTIAFGPTTPVANAPYLVKGVRYNVESFTYICQVFENVFTIAVGPQSKVTSVQELLAAAKANPGKLTYGHAGLGTIPHLSMENAVRGAEPQIRSGAVPRRCAAGSGAAPRRDRFRRGRGVDHPPAAVDPAARDLLRQAPSGLSGHPDRQGARRRDRRAAGTQRLFAPRGLRRMSATRSKAPAARSSSRSPWRR